MTELFAGVIVVALVGNAAEHYSAIAAAMKNDMTLALEISVGSSAQIALMVAPLLVLIAPLLGQPMSLVFNAFEIAAIGLSVGTVALVAMDGESNWLEGLQLLGLYMILGAAFYVIPGIRGCAAPAQPHACAHAPHAHKSAVSRRSRIAALAARLLPMTT